MGLVYHILSENATHFLAIRGKPCIIEGRGGVTMTKQEYYTVAEVAAQLRVSADTVMRLLRAEKLQGEKVGKQWRIRDAALQHYLKTSKKKG